MSMAAGIVGMRRVTTHEEMTAGSSSRRRRAAPMPGRKSTTDQKRSQCIIYVVFFCLFSFIFLQFFVFQKRWATSLALMGTSTRSHGDLAIAAAAYNNWNLGLNPSIKEREGLHESKSIKDVRKSMGAVRKRMMELASAACLGSKLLAITDNVVDVEKLRAECRQTADVDPADRPNTSGARQDYHVLDPSEITDSGTVASNSKTVVVPRTAKALAVAATRDQQTTAMATMPQQLDQIIDSFLPLKDIKQPVTPENEGNWFMSSVVAKPGSGLGEILDFPSDDPEGRLLCLQGSADDDGSKNSYGFLHKKDLVKVGARFREGITLVVENYWNYDNPWHSMSAMLGFAFWRAKFGACMIPERVVMYHLGEFQEKMGSWIANVMHATMGKSLKIENLGNSGNEPAAHGAPVCFERAIVQRRGLGGIPSDNLRDLFDMVRCKALKFCAIDTEENARNTGSTMTVKVTLLTRTGARAFRNASAVAAVVKGECAKVPECHFRVATMEGLSFCEQVELMTTTDVLVTVHGAQITNAMFMTAGASLMEMYPKGWLEYMGVGQLIYQFLADWAKLVHEGVWRDSEGPDCPYPSTETLRCLYFHKDSEVGLNATHLAQWTENVLHNFLERKKQAGNEDPKRNKELTICPCEDVYTFH